MAEKWTTLRFISGFLERTLGRKKIHGSYRVLEGDNCKLLVRATTQYGLPDGNALIAVDLSDENNKMIFWRMGYNNSFTYRMTRHSDEDMGGYQTLPELILSGEEENLLHSGIVDINLTHALIEIGDKPFLLHREITDGQAQTVTIGKGYAYANQVPRRVASIREALEKVKDPTDDRKICQEWWAKEMPLTFQPPEFDPELVKVLSTALNPIDFGFSIDNCVIALVTGAGYENKGQRSFVPKMKILKATPKTTKIQRWVDAVTKWSDAADKLIKRKPAVHKGLSVHNSRYVSLANQDERTGTILVTDEGVYLTGEVHSHSDWIQSDILTNWYKLTQHANQINIPKCI